jgi:hypothetical protein
MLAVVGVHSQLEYPLWYAYFLLPTALLAGWACSGGAQPLTTGSASARRAGSGGVQRPLALAVGAVTVTMSAWAAAQYYTVAVIFDPGLSFGDADLLPQRIARGQRSLFFGHHADYAEVTMAEAPQSVLAHFDRPAYHLWDTRLMTAYAKSLAAHGDVEAARSVAARLREFRNPAADEFFAECTSARPATAALPFQCGVDPQWPAQALRPLAIAAGSARP